MEKGREGKEEGEEGREVDQERPVGSLWKL